MMGTEWCVEKLKPGTRLKCKNGTVRFLIVFSGFTSPEDEELYFPGPWWMQVELETMCGFPPLRTEEMVRILNEGGFQIDA